MREFIIFISACSCLILPGKDLHVFSHSEYAWLQLPAPAPVAFPSLLRSLSELGVFPHQAAPCCEHIVFQVSPQLAKQVEVLNPSLQSVPFHPQIIFMALFLHWLPLYHPSNACGWPQPVIPRGWSHLPALGLSSAGTSQSRAGFLAAESR